MNYEACESFIDFCDRMTIANESIVLTDQRDLYAIDLALKASREMVDKILDGIGDADCEILFPLTKEEVLGYNQGLSQNRVYIMLMITSGVINPSVIKELQAKWKSVIPKGCIIRKDKYNSYDMYSLDCRNMKVIPSKAKISNIFGIK